MVVNPDRAEELPNDLIEALARRTDGSAVAAMRALADVTGNVYLRGSAERLAAQVAAHRWHTRSPPSTTVSSHRREHRGAVRQHLERWHQAGRPRGPGTVHTPDR